MIRAVFLDRDGVINRQFERARRGFAPRTLEEFKILPGVKETITRFKAKGFLVIVVTNQPDVATGKTAREVVEAMHEKLRSELAVEDIYVCYHADADNCDCRKPESGMLRAAARDWDIELEQSFMVGDRWRDIAAGKDVGCKTVFVDYGYAEPWPKGPDAVVSSLAEAGPVIFGGGSARTEV